MYSLYYRAWFGGERSYPRPETLSPPDCVVRAGSEGEYYFPAHRAVLAAHSDYLKASLADHVNSAGGNHHESPAAGPVVVSVSVPSDIGVEAFVPLLKYMYTGRLEVGPDNIYTVLPATYRLQMPGALEQCRAALLELCATPAAVAAAAAAFVTSPVVVNGTTTIAPSSPTTSILRPVPNRLLAPPPPIYWPEGTSLYPPPPPPPRHLDLPHLPALQIPSGSVGTLSAPLVSLNSTTCFRGNKECSKSPISRRGSESNSPELVVASSTSSPVPVEEQQQTTTKQTSPSASGISERTSVGDEDRQRQQQNQPRRRRLQQQQQQQRTVYRRNSSGRSDKAAGSQAASSAASTTGVVFDVAWCDGPVRFERVRNENYAPCGVQNSPNRHHNKQQCSSRSSYHTSDPSSSPTSTPTCHTIENDENAQSSPLTTANNNINQSTGTPGSNNQSYTCSHCHHTFKSQYCYRKHARRHLLQPTSISSSDSSLQQQRAPEKQVARHLDPNVQYYPCKICGNKFPSYYFVHKHRMLKHANIDKQPQGKTSDAVKGSKSVTGQQKQQEVVEKVEQQQA